MKTHSLTIAAAALLLASCASHYVATDTVHRNCDITRTLLSADTASLVGTPYATWGHTALETRQTVDFRTTKDTMRYAYSATLPRGGWALTPDSLPRQLRPEVTVRRQFRLFATRYTYTALFHAIDSLPVPIDTYLTAEEQQLLFGRNEWPADWNGADLYALLDRLNEKYVRWMSHCIFEAEYDVLLGELDSAQRQLTAAHHDTLLALALAALPDQQKSLLDVATQIPALAFLASYRSSGADDDGLTALDLLERMDANVRVLWRIELPGGRTEEHMVSAERLLTGDYVLTLAASSPNWWAIAIAALLLAAVALWLGLRRNRM